MTNTYTPLTGDRTDRSDLLQAALNGLLGLSNLAREIGWNLKTSEDSQLHAMLDQVMDDSAAFSDLIARRIVKLETYAFARPDTRHPDEGDWIDTYSEEQTLTALETRISRHRARLSDASSRLKALSDQKSADILKDILQATEKWLWRIEKSRD